MPQPIPGVPDITEAANVLQGVESFLATEAAGEELREQLTTAAGNLALATESYADIALALEDRGWQRIGLEGDRQFTRSGLIQAATLCRTMAVVNPLIRRGLQLRTAYVWGGGVEIAARSTGPTDDEPQVQDVNAVVQDFLDDRAVRKVLTSAVARETNERTLGTDGMVAIALFTKPLTGRVQPRVVPTDEIAEVVTNPNDRSDVWFYKRVWVDRSAPADAPSGSRSAGTTRTTWHPDVDYRPRGARVTQVKAGAETGEVLWDAPIALLTVNGLDGWDFGIGDAFAAIPFARGYKEFLEDWTRLVKALSRFAWRTTAPSKGAAANTARAIQAAQVGPADGTPGPVGGVANMGAGQSLEAIPKSGATIDAGSGRPLAAMVASAMDVPVTMLLGDPGVTGSRATAETLDKPTELMATQRRSVWSDFYTRLLDYVIDAAVRAPRGALTGTVTRDEWDREEVTLAGDTDRTIEVTWPDLSETTMEEAVRAVVLADSTGKFPGIETLRELLHALGRDDVDELVERYSDEEGNLQLADVEQEQRDRLDGNDPAAGLYGSGAPPAPEEGPAERTDPDA